MARRKPTSCSWELAQDEQLATDPAAAARYQELADALAAGTWQGDRDDWQQPLANADWQRVTIDNAGCMGAKCSNFRNCCFYQARAKVEQADCVVANQDLVLADLALGGGAILPAPERTIYIIDEAHHLPVKSNNHFAAFTQVNGTLNWLKRVENAGKGLLQDQFIKQAGRDELQALSTRLQEQVQQAQVLLQQIINRIEQADSYNEYPATCVQPWGGAGRVAGCCRKHRHQF